MYNHKEIEKKWQNYWEQSQTFRTPELHETGFNGRPVSEQKKFYVLDMFPYPSGAGLHVGHPEGYTANDIVARYKHARGYNVLHPMGWDAFGLPAENYAVKTGVHPRITTEQNIATFKRQIQSLGFSYDWDREIDTTDPEYYKWTQWIFLKLFEHGLAYEQDLPVNWCPALKAVLANEEVVNGRSEIGDHPVERKKLRQWVLGITQYIEDKYDEDGNLIRKGLLNGVDNLDWPEGIKDMQRNWIGKSEGCEFEMKLASSSKNEAQKKGELPLFNSEGGLNCPAKLSPTVSIVNNVPKVKKKSIFLYELDAVIENDEKKIIIKSKNIFKHFVSKSSTEFYRRKNLLPALYEALGNIPFEDNIGYFIVDNTVVKVVLGKQSNEKWFVKTYYIADRHTYLYRKTISPDSGEEQASIRVYTTRIDTVFGVTYAVIAPDHPEVQKFITDSERQACKNYIKNVVNESDQERTADNKEKTGVFTGSYVINPYNSEEVPLWIADYVLGNYGTGAVMAVPAHDERDFEFAKKYGLEVRPVIAEYNILTGENAPKEGIFTREKKCVTVIVKHPTEKRYLVQNFENGELGFTGGGIEENETPQEAVIRELKEESGLENIEKIYLSSIMVGHGYKPRKEMNCKDPDYVFFTKLTNLDGFQEDCFENVNYKNEWYTQEQILENPTFKSHHKKQFQDFLKGPHATINYGILLDSGKYNGLTSQEAKEVFMKLAEEQGFGTRKVNYKLRDWLFSRQRYWGEPIPLIHLKVSDVEKLPTTQSDDAWVKNGDTLMIGEKEFSKIYDGLYTKIVCDYSLPLKLPPVEKYEPSSDGQSPLANIDDFVNVELAANLSGKRETNTMPQWGGSCWYYLRFMDAKNPEELVSSGAEKYWGSVDSYVGGAEHAVLHLLYARFWHKFLYDIGVVSTTEPFQRLRNQGMILGMSYKTSDGRLIASDLVREEGGKFYHTETGDELQKIPAKMSKSLKNVINPDEIVELYGADTLRLYEMYMGDFADSKPWDTTAIIGCRRFLEKVYRAFEIKGGHKYNDVNTESEFKNDKESLKVLHKSIKKITEDIENYKFNTAIAQLMILIKHIPDIKGPNSIWGDFRRKFLILLHPFAPHMAEELWNQEQELELKYGGFLKAYYATGNDGKIKRAQSVLDTLRSAMKLEKIPELIEVEENALTARECALQKLEAYKGKGYKVPIICSDTSVHFEKQDFEPTKVRRAAIEASGKQESELTKMQIAELMIEFYKNIATQNGGTVDFYYTDAFAVLFPDGSVQTSEYKREYTLTNELKGDIYSDVPMRSLYISKVTGKRAHETTMQDYIKEFSCQAQAFSQLFGLGQTSIFFESWPEYDEALTVDSEVTIGVQVLGKLRGEIQIAVDEDKDSVLAKAKSNPDVMKWLEGKDIVKEIYVPGKIVNIVVK